MEKQVYNFEALTKIRKKREKNRRIKMIMAAICIVAVLIVLYILSSSRCEYYVYKDKTDTEDNVDVSYETFADGYLKYSSNGIEFQKKFGRSEWNVALSEYRTTIPSVRFPWIPRSGPSNSSGRARRIPVVH